MKVAILVEGKTETSFKPILLDFLRTRLAGTMPKLDIVPYHGRIPTGEKLSRVVRRLLHESKQPAAAVIALTDVYTGSTPPEFATAAEAKEKMRQWVGPESRFHPHVALHDFEAWLLPYWAKIQKITGSNRNAPGADPEKINHGNPPAYRLAAVFSSGPKTRGYVKARDAGRILRGEDLGVAIGACSELKAFVNTILKLCNGQEIP